MRTTTSFVERASPNRLIRNRFTLNIKPFAVVTGLLILTGCATTLPTDRTNQQLNVIHQDLSVLEAQITSLQKLTIASNTANTSNVCYLDSKSYSKSAIVAGRVCGGAGLNVAGQAQPPIWQTKRTTTK